MLHSFLKDRSIKFLERPEDMITAVPLGNVVAHNLLENSRRRKIFDLQIADYYWQRKMMTGFSIKAIMVEVDRPKVKGAFITTRGKAVLNGAAAHRARNKLRKNMEYGQDSIYIFDSIFAELLDPRSMVIDLPGRDCVFIEAKNFYNFFHFTSESLHQAFSSCISSGIFKNICYITRNKRIEPYIEKWVSECNDLLTQSVSLKSFPHGEDIDSKSLIMPMSCEHLLYQFSGSHHDTIEAARPAGNLWTGYNARPHPVKVVQLNSFDDSLNVFKEKLVEASKTKVSKGWSKFIYAARSKETARKRIMDGEDFLIEKLLSIGFEIVYFENMSPLEQVKCVNEADCLIGQHGAGLANMIFANKNAHIFEVATYQTAMSRWADFIPLCHVAGCHYHLIVVGMTFDSEDRDPSYVEDGFFAPVVSQQDVEKIIKIVKSALCDKKEGGLSGLIRHCRFFISKGAYAQAYRLLDKNMIFFAKHSEYWELRAELAELCGHNERAYECFLKSYSISKSQAAWDGMVRFDNK